MKIRLSSIRLRRDGLYWLSFGEQDNVLTIAINRFPAWPKQYGRTVAITPEALAENPAKTVFDACERLIDNAQDTHSLLRSKGKRGLDFRTFQVLYVPAGCDEFCRPHVELDHSKTLISWKASAA